MCFIILRVTDYCLVKGSFLVVYTYVFFNEFYFMTYVLECSLIMTSNLDRSYGLFMFSVLLETIYDSIFVVLSSTVFLGILYVSRVKLTLV